jgi:hypothetical protein
MYCSSIDDIVSLIMHFRLSGWGAFDLMREDENANKRFSMGICIGSIVGSDLCISRQSGLKA